MAYSMTPVLGKCRACPWDMNDPRHFREHVPPQHWPRKMFEKRKRIVINGRVYNPEDTELDEWGNPTLKRATEPSADLVSVDSTPLNTRPVCKCGWAPKVTSLHPENDIRLHTVKSSKHKVPVTNV